jgi:hypothetical protein
VVVEVELVCIVEVALLVVEVELLCVVEVALLVVEVELLVVDRLDVDVELASLVVEVEKVAAEEPTVALLVVEAVEGASLDDCSVDVGGDSLVPMKLPSRRPGPPGSLAPVAPGSLANGAGGDVLVTGSRTFACFCPPSPRFGLSQSPRTTGCFARWTPWISMP